MLLLVDLGMTLSEFPSDSQERCGHNVGTSGKVIMNMIQCKTINRWRELSLGPVMASIHDSEQGVEAGGQEVLDGDTNKLGNMLLDELLIFQVIGSWLVKLTSTVV